MSVEVNHTKARPRKGLAAATPLLPEKFQIAVDDRQKVSKNGVGVCLRQQD
jgi:phage tail protein X